MANKKIIETNVSFPNVDALSMIPQDKAIIDYQSNPVRTASNSSRTQYIQQEQTSFGPMFIQS